MRWLRKLLGLESRSPARLVEISTASTEPSQPLSVLWRADSYPMEVVGESFYQSALEQICGGHSRAGHELKLRARLVAERNNASDNNARMVLIAGKHVGYLSREQAARIRDELVKIDRAGADIEAAAVIRGGWRTNQYDEGSFGVRLAIPARGAISFEGFSKTVELPQRRKPVSAANLATTISQEELESLDALIGRLEVTPPLSKEAEAQKYDAFRRSFSSGSTASTRSPGELAPDDHLVRGEDHFRSEMARMNNLLGEQIRIFQAGLDRWFTHGEHFAPYYPHRIAVILRKAKRKDLETAFLAAYVSHFADLHRVGGRYAEIVDRAAKLGIPMTT